MAVMGVQVVVTLLAASLMQKLAPHCSFARWLLCNGSLYRYKHPTDEELCALAGKQQRPKGRRDRRTNGVTEDKPLSVPCDIDLQLDTSPITAVDALVLRHFAEYQWLVDLAVYAVAVFLFSEAHLGLAGAREPHLGALWSLLSLLACLRVFSLVTRHFFSSEEGGERSVCLSFALLFLLLAMLALAVREEYLEFGLEAGLAAVSDNLEPILKPRGWEWTLPLARLAFKLALVALCSFLGACLTFPGLRLAQTHLDALRMAQDKPLTQLLLHAGFVSPVLVVLLWVRPLARDFLLQAPLGSLGTVQILSGPGFDSARLWALVALSLLRLLGTRHHLQAYLGLAPRWVSRLRREAGRIPARDIQRKISRIYCYVSVVSLQYLGPVILSLHCTLLLKTLGQLSWGLFPASPAVSPAVAPVSPVPPGGDSDSDSDGDVQEAVAELSALLRALLTPLFLRGLFSFLTWWVAACQVVTSLCGLYCHRHLAAS